MKRITAFIALFVVSLLLLPRLSLAQAREGTVEASWNRAEKSGQYHTPPASTPRSIDSYRQQEKHTATAWEKQRSKATHPWPNLPANPTAHDYHSVNTAVIDSLSHLYCLSPGYITTLRGRNDDAMKAIPGSGERDFSYTEGNRTAAKEASRPSLQALYKELLQLLDRCLAGR
ncbi:MAG: hypothetical protein M5R41_02780 [Bacteroidia bacterium]|nr:hypothetical protein [Bacteroidia bacterium]